MNTVLDGDLSVYTTIDLEEQLAALEVTRAFRYLPDAGDPDLALVSIEPETGRTKTMVGDRNDNSQFNLVTPGRRQPGSSFKPFALIAALEQGIDPEYRVVSEEKEYEVDVAPGKPETWKVQNYEGMERGEISLQEALWQSDNTVFADPAMNAGGRGLKNGPEKIADVAESAGSPRVSRTSQAFYRTRRVRSLPPRPGIGLRDYCEPRTQGGTDSDHQSSQPRGRNGREGTLCGAPKIPRASVISEDVANEATGIMVGDVTEGIANDASLGDRPSRQDWYERELLRRLVYRFHSRTGYRNVVGYAKAGRPSNASWSTPANYMDSQAASPRPRSGRLNKSC